MGRWSDGARVLSLWAIVDGQRWLFVESLGDGQWSKMRLLLERRNVCSCRLVGVADGVGSRGRLECRFVRVVSSVLFRVDSLLVRERRGCLVEAIAL